MSCKWNGRGEPRVLSGRHDADCPGETCPGCLPCTEPHCRVCHREHSLGTCGDCMDETRTALRGIGVMCGALPAEVRHRGVNGEALTLLGPTGDVEARQHVEASYLAGRLPEGWLERSHGKECPILVNDPCLGCRGGELHPLAVLGTWDMAVRDSLEHDEGGERITVASAIDYLDRQLTYLGGYDLLPFEDMARDIRRCHAHLLAVLHDQNEGDRANVGCFECGGDLERRLTDRGFEDHWTCDRCRRRYTYAEYNFALRASLEEATRKKPA